LFNGSKDTSSFSFNKFALQLENINAENIVDQYFIVDLRSVQGALESEVSLKTNSTKVTEVALKAMKNSTGYVRILKELLLKAYEQSEIAARVSYMVFLTDILFQTTEHQSKVNSLVLSTRIGSYENTTLEMNISVMFEKKRNESELVEMFMNDTITVSVWNVYS